MEKIFACESKFLLDYLNKVENCSNEQRLEALNLFSKKENDYEDILDIKGDTGYINITGVLSRQGPSPIDKFFGFSGTGYKDIIDALIACEENPHIKNIVLCMDTPGGEVNGVEEARKKIADLASRKFVRAENHGMIASGGYWLASAANEIISLSDACLTGSIGVVITAVDRSKMLEDLGIKIVNIVSRNAPAKRPDIKTKEGRDILQEQADAIERVFMSKISEGRNCPMEDIQENFGRGGMLISYDPEDDKSDACTCKMIDGVKHMMDDDEMEDDDNEFDSLGGNL